MKRVIVSILVVLTICVIATECFAAVSGAWDSRRNSRGARSRYSSGRSRRPVADANSIFAKVDSISDANAVKNAIKGFDGLEKQLTGLDNKSKSESRQWLGKQEIDRMKLMTSVQKQIIAELGLIRELAEKEGAKQSVAAIDGILLARQSRYGRSVRKLERDQMRMQRGPRGRTGYRDQRSWQGDTRGNYPDDTRDVGRRR